MNPQLFESFVNSERCKTVQRFKTILVRLRALLIQKDVKQPVLESELHPGLRALLIQKDVKLSTILPVCIWV